VGYHVPIRFIAPDTQEPEPRYPFRSVEVSKSEEPDFGSTSVNYDLDLSRRYRLERVKSTLALQVVDQDMGDEIRSVHSMSGGESFLVSLALALGLASLSSNRV